MLLFIGLYDMIVPDNMFIQQPAIKTVTFRPSAGHSKAPVASTKSRSWPVFTSTPMKAWDIWDFGKRQGH
jgi:hypothetical protein